MMMIFSNDSLVFTRYVYANDCRKKSHFGIFRYVSTSTIRNKMGEIKNLVVFEPRLQEDPK